MTSICSARFALLVGVALVTQRAWADDWKKLDEAGSRARVQKNYAEAEKLYQAALKEAAKSEPNGIGEKTARTLNNLALAYAGLDRYTEAEPLLQRALAILETKKPQSRELGRAWANLGWVYQHQHKYELAEPLYKRALELRQRILKPDDYDISLNLEDLGFLYQAQGKYSQAEAIWSRSLAIWEELDRTGRPGAPPFIARGLYNVGVFYYFVGKYFKAAPILRRCLEIQEKTLGPEHEDVASTLLYLGSIEGESKHYLAAEQLLRRAQSIREKRFGPHQLKTAFAYSDLAALYVDQKRFNEAAPLLNDALAIVNNSKESDRKEFGSNVYWPLYARAILYVEQGDFSDAEPLLRRSLGILENDAEEPRQPYVVVDSAVVIASLGRTYSEQGRLEEAESLFARALAAFDAAGLGEHPKIYSCLKDYGALLRKAGRQTEAEAMENRAAAIRAGLASVGSGG